jgi:heme-degrading monooxygenase HmoA
MKRRCIMFARILEVVPRMEKKEEFVRVIKNEVVPILAKQHGFLEMLPFFPEAKNEKMIVISLWTEKKDAERYVREALPKVEEILKPYMAAQILYGNYAVETTLCEHFEKTLVA